MFLRPFLDRFPFHSPNDTQHHVGRSVVAGHKFQHLASRQALNMLGISQNFHTQGVPLEQQRLKLLKNHVGRLVFHPCDFVEDDVAFFVQFVLRKHALERDVRHQLNRPLRMRGTLRRRDPRFFLRREGVHLSPHRFHAIQDMKGLSGSCAFEQGVLDEVRQPRLALGLVARSRLDGQSAMAGFPRHPGMDQPEAIGKHMGSKFLLHHPTQNNMATVMVVPATSMIKSVKGKMSRADSPVMPSKGSAQKGCNMFVNSSPNAMAMMPRSNGTPNAWQASNTKGP